MMRVTRQITLAFDMYGCPNRCRHCYLGPATSDQMDADEIRDIVAAFRIYHRAGESEPYFYEIKVATWAREPDYAADYRGLYALEEALSDGPPRRFQLLSVYRLARDPDYAVWAREIGTRACQISFFGLRETQDWFFRRRGAFDDCLLATERLLAHGISPRWQLFVTRKLLPELAGLLKHAAEFGLETPGKETAEGLSVFAHLPAPDGAARKLEWLRPAIDELEGLPWELCEASRTHLQRATLWQSEAQWLAQLGRTEQARAYDVPDRLAFYVLPGGDVYSNVATLEPWWRLGNIHTDGVAAIVKAFEQATPLGFQALHENSCQDLVAQHADAARRGAYGSLSDLLMRYLGDHCEQIWSTGARTPLQG